MEAALERHSYDFVESQCPYVWININMVQKSQKLLGQRKGFYWDQVLKNQLTF